MVLGPALRRVGVIGGLQLLGADDGQRVTDHIAGEHIKGHVGEQIAAGEHLLMPRLVVLGPAEGLLDPVELRRPLLQRRIRMLIQPRLEGVDGAEGAQLLDEVIAMLRQELGGMVTEEIRRIGLAQQLHGLGMDLRQIGAQPRIVRYRLAADRQIPLQPVSQLVGVYGDVIGGAVAVGKDKGHPVGRAQHIAETHTGNFIGRACHVQQVVADHLIEKFPSLGAERVVHPVGCLGQPLRRHRHGVALREHQRPVIGSQHIHAQT